MNLARLLIMRTTLSLKKRLLEGDGSMIVSTNSIGKDTPPDANRCR